MSVPPPGYYPVPPPAPKKSGFTGWHAAGIGCLAVFLLIVIGGVIAVRSFKAQMAHPDKNSAMGLGVVAGQAGMQGALLRQAIVRYHAQHGQYPKTLEQMYGDGSLDGKMLHNGLDDDPNPGHVSWQYTKPAEGAPGTTPILKESYHVTLGGGSQPGQIVITLNGQSQTGNVSAAPQQP